MYYNIVAIASLQVRASSIATFKDSYFQNCWCGVRHM